MKTPHLLRVEQGAAELAPLFEAARALGLRIGWLELGEIADPLPPGLEAAAGEGTLRAVAVGGGRTVAVKPMKGAPVLRDLLREHFRGCALVLVFGGGAADLPSLTRDGEAYRVASGSVVRTFDATHLAAALRRPRPFEAEGETTVTGEAAPAVVS